MAVERRRDVGLGEARLADDHVRERLGRGELGRGTAARGGRVERVRERERRGVRFREGGRARRDAPREEREQREDGEAAGHRSGSARGVS